MNNILETKEEYLGIPFREDSIIDELISTEVIELNSSAVLDVDIPGLEFDIDDINDYFDSSGNLINDIINARIDTSSKYILSDFNFGTTDYAGALKTGDITWNTSTGAVTGGSGIVINRAGIIGAKAGVAQFSIDTSGNAVFKGDVTGATGTFGVVTIEATSTVSNAAVSGLGDLALEDTVGAADCDATIISGGKIITGLLTATNIQTGTLTGITITGNTIQTATSGRRVKITTDQYIRFYNGNDVECYIGNDGTGKLEIDADNSITITSNGADDDISLVADDLVYTDSDIFWAKCNGYFKTECDNCFIDYNDDNDGSYCYWNDRGDDEMKLDASGELYIDGSLHEGGADYAEYFESIDGKEIEIGTTVILEEDKIKPSTEGTQPIGVISGTSSVIANEDVDCGGNWNGKYAKDEYGRRIIEESEWWSIKEKKTFKKSNGKTYTRNEKLSNYSDIEKAPKGAKKKMAMREKLNPDWNPKQEYKTRKDRPEWNIVGLLGRVRITKGQPVSPTWIKLREISDKVDEYLIK